MSQPPTLPEAVRAHAASVVADARWVRVDLDRLASYDPQVEQPAAPALDPSRHFLDGPEEDVARFCLTLTAINFGSGWFPTLRKRPGMSGYFTVASSLTDRFRAEGPWSNEELRALTADEVAAVMGQRRDHELMALFAQALRQLGGWLGSRGALEVVREAGGSAVALATLVGSSMSMWNDRGFYKRAQILASDLSLAGVASFSDLDALTIFADNLVPHVLRCDGVLVHDPLLAAHIDGEQLLTNAAQEREIRAAAVYACAELSRRTGVPERVIDMWLWTRGQAPEYKARPRHQSRTVFY
ncbi:MAG TPA: queuosine salvage family protein [Solirubrobacteraceae bacterium]|nr:queuosine salvage family protein [Solirubrobacteraceae bacterium]